MAPAYISGFSPAGDGTPAERAALQLLTDCIKIRFKYQIYNLIHNTLWQYLYNFCKVKIQRLKFRE